MAWRIEFSPLAAKEFDRLDSVIQARIQKHLKERVLPHPKFFGEALIGDKKGLWRYRIGDYRMVVRIQQEILLIMIIHVAHRKEVYD